ncbi:DUF7139 domain-containing protein [Halorarius litoreus]|uniref:DUF7139 domain-containing protein n=1 Tax=Halorarius litoreus TaxID=2962676 RepID=UPI0020CE0910|nr:hypothetical protein [Halorarius litoreus]
MTSDSDDRIVAFYRRYLGDPERELDVYLGFVLFIGGFALGIVGLLLFAVEQVTATGRPIWWLREIAFVVGALGLPTLLVGVTVLLPVDRRASYLATLGLTVTIVAAAFFVTVYPGQWNVDGQDQSLQGVLIYAVGLVTVLASTGAALVSYHVERTKGVPMDAEDEAIDEEDEEAVAARARRDYEEAMANSEVSWGGVRKTDVSRRLRIRDDSGDIDTSGFDSVAAEERRDSGANVDAAVAGLKSLRGGNRREDRATGETTDDQAAALAALRQQEEHTETRRRQERGRLGALADRLTDVLKRN